MMVAKLFSMHGYGFFVWLAYAIGGVAITASFFHLSFKNKQKYKALKRFYYEQEVMDESR